MLLCIRFLINKRGRSLNIRAPGFLIMEPVFKYLCTWFLIMGPVFKYLCTRFLINNGTGLYIFVHLVFNFKGTDLYFILV